MRWDAAAVCRIWLFQTKIGAGVGFGEEQHSCCPEGRFHSLTSRRLPSDSLSALPVSHRVAVEASARCQLLAAPAQKRPSCPYLSPEYYHLRHLLQCAAGYTAGRARKIRCAYRSYRTVRFLSEKEPNRSDALGQDCPGTSPWILYRLLEILPAIKTERSLRIN